MGGYNLTTITDEFMLEIMSHIKTYTIVILKPGPNKNSPGVEKIIWEHARRNFTLRADGVLSIVCPISDGSNVCGLYIFNAGVEEVEEIMNDDPGVKEGVFVYEIHPGRSFPGDRLSE